MKAALRVIYPPQCSGCGACVGAEGSLCPDCWREAEPVGTACGICAVPLPGAEAGDCCEDCAMIVRPWGQGRAAMLYNGTGRRMVLAFKHGDRPDLAVVMGRWMAAAAGDLIGPDTLLAPVPLHPRRLLARRYNQAALLAGAMARQAGGRAVPDLLCRTRHTAGQGHRDAAERWENLTGALTVTPRRAAAVKGAHVLLVDDVVASGATLTHAADALREAGAARVDMAVFARAVKGRVD